MSNMVEEYMLLPYVVEVVPDQATDGSLCYRAYNPELPGCMSHGDTPQDAVENLEEARRLYIETLIEMGEEIPKPQPRGTSTHYQQAIWSVTFSLAVKEKNDVQVNFPAASPVYGR
ncbi:MAG: type II toxin-antitoxin system HicB family antitoxin [Nitrospirae bacterium]|nr:type II toxin-antitoxin system HicB family antitoxin [Nitrospirota bacterium]